MCSWLNLIFIQTSHLSSPATRSPGSHCIRYRPSRGQHPHRPAAFISWSRPSWPCVLPGLHPGGALRRRGGKAGGASEEPVWCHRGVWSCGASGRLGNVRHLLQSRSEGGPSLRVCHFTSLAVYISIAWHIHLSAPNAHMVPLVAFASVACRWENVFMVWSRQ